MENNIGRRVKERRKELKMNQTMLANKSNVSRERISAIENGKCKNVLIGTLTAIATALETNVEFFLN